MKKKKFSLIILFIAINTFSFVAGILYCSYINKKFYDTVSGITLNENRNRWGKPDKTNINKFEIIDTYRSILPLNKYMFFYKKQDSILINTWKEY